MQLRSRVKELAQGNDEVTINKITGGSQITGTHMYMYISCVYLQCHRCLLFLPVEELMKLSVQEQTSLLSRPDLLQQRVREVESILRR